MKLMQIKFQWFHIFITRVNFPALFFLLKLVLIVIKSTNWRRKAGGQGLLYLVGGNTLLFGGGAHGQRGGVPVRYVIEISIPPGIERWAQWEALFFIQCFSISPIHQVEVTHLVIVSRAETLGEGTLENLLWVRWSRKGCHQGHKKTKQGPCRQ